MKQRDLKEIAHSVSNVGERKVSKEIVWKPDEEKQAGLNDVIERLGLPVDGLGSSQKAIWLSLEFFRQHLKGLETQYPSSFSREDVLKIFSTVAERMHKPKMKHAGGRPKKKVQLMGSDVPLSGVSGEDQ